LQILLVVVLIFINAFFAMAEIALITVRRTRIRQLVEEGNKSALLVEQMLDHPTRMMATIQTGVTLIATFSSAIAASSVGATLEVWLRTRYQGTWLDHSAGAVSVVLVALPVAVATLVIGEIAPKSLAVRHPERFALIAVHPIRWLQMLLTPVVHVLTFLSNLVVRPFGGTASFTPHTVDEEELKMIVQQGVEQGVIEQEEQEMVHSVLEFADTVVRKVMTPRIDITAMDVTASVAAIIALIQESGHSRIPVYEGDLDNILGIVHAKDLLPLPLERREDVSLKEVMRPAYFIPESKKVNDLLTEFRRSKQQLAIVRDEYGVTAGLITIEDLLEEIVGEIQDEYDEEEPRWQILNDHTTVLDGLVGLSEVNDRMGLDLPEDEADTIGGFVFNLLGHQAQQGERATYEYVDFIVEATDGRRITKVRLILHPHPRPETLPDASAEETPQVPETEEGSAPTAVEPTPNPLTR